MNLYDYLQSNEPYFWKWEEDCTLIEIQDGNTIAYTQQVKEMMIHMADSGLPSFGCLLLVMIATGKNAATSLLQVKDMLVLGNKKIDTEAFSEEHVSILNEAFSFLQLLKEVPQKHVAGNNKLRLFQTIFMEAHNKLSVKKSKKLIEASEGYIDTALLARASPFYQGLISRDFKTLALLNRRFPTVNAILEKMVDLPKDDIDINNLEDDLLREVKEKDFVDELIENPKTFHVGSLLKPLWAGFKIPINTTMPSQQQFGGISDLTNKGDFDKLLISEFANDDLTFMSRLANNEALYMHREMPPAVDDQQRILLMDISLMSWGTPKVLAHACSIAISRHPKALSQSRSFIIGQSYREVHFDTIDGIIEALQQTDNSLHPAAGMDLFLKEYNENKKPEIFLMITPHALKMPAVQRVLSEYAGLFKYIITVEMNGILSFYKFKSGNKKLLQQIKLNLPEHWRKIPAATKSTEQSLSENGYPILFAAPQNISRALMVPYQELFIISERMLFRRLHQSNKGYALVAEHIALAQKFAIGKYKNGATHFLSFNPQTKVLSILNIDTKESAFLTFGHWRASKVDFFFYNDERYLPGFYHFNNTGLYYFSLEDNKIVTTDTRIELSDLRIIMAKSEEEQAKLARTRSHSSIFKNLKMIGINIYHKLSFNQHELSLDNNAIILGGGKTSSQIIAESTYDITTNKYIFADGSSVTWHGAGMFILKSSNKNLPDIYIPSVLNTKIGMATDNSFSGNDYYNPYSGKDHQLYEVSLVDAGSNKLQLIKELKEETDYSLKQLKEIVDSNKSTLLKTNMTHANAYNLHNKLIRNGAKAKLAMAERFNKRDNYEVIEVSHFNEAHLKPFIQNILQHAGTSKTR